MQLFAKHNKIEQQEEQLRKAPTHVAVGTPERIRQLVDRGSIALDQLQLVSMTRFAVIESH